MQAYALGWTVQDYRGEKLIWHRGAVFGSLAAVALLPERNIGIYVAVNSEGGRMIRGSSTSCSTIISAFRARLAREAAPVPHLTLRRRRQVPRRPGRQAAKVGPSLPPSRYAGDYADPWYGPIASARRTGG